MPKLIKQPEDKRKNMLQANINYLCEITGTTAESLKISARLSDYQYCQRRKDPGKYTYDELLRIAKKLHTSVADLMIEREAVRL